MKPDELRKLVHRNTKNLAYFRDMLKDGKKNVAHLISKTECDVCEAKGKSYVFDIDPDAPFVGKTKSSRRMVVCPECLEKAAE